MAQSLRWQTLTLTLANAYTRAMGFGLRLLTARLMGPEALGVMEMANSAAMLAITPVTAGLPAAVSRLTARPEADAGRVLASGLHLVRRLSLALIPLTALLSPAAAWLLGDWRTLPAMLAAAPLSLLLGLCGVCSGWFCARQDMRTPALNECAEQTVRCGLCSALLVLCAGQGVAMRAALPGVAEVLAGLAVWGLYRRRLPARPAPLPGDDAQRELLHLAAPLTASCLCQTGLRALNAVLLPVCLRRSGLSAQAATAAFGLLSGMALPLVMAPGVITGALCTVAGPAVSRQEGHPQQLLRTMRRLIRAGAGVGCAAAAGLFLLADFIAQHLCGTPALTPLLRLMCPMALLLAVQQVQAGLIAGLGLQGKMLPVTLWTSVMTLLLTALLCPQPALRLTGAALASIASSLVRMLWGQRILRRAAAAGTPPSAGVCPRQL